MKRLFTTTMLFAAAGLTGTAAAAPISGTGFTADGIVEASAASIAAGSDLTVTANWVPLVSGFGGIGPGLPLPASGAVTTVNGTNFQLASQTGDNVLVNGNTFTLAAPGQYADLQFLYTGIGSNSSVDATPYTNFTATVNFSDTSTTALTASVKDWQSGGGGSSEVTDAFAEKSAFGRNNGTEATLALWIREVSFDLSALDEAKTINSITFTLGDRGAVAAVSGTAVPEPSSLALLGLGGLAMLRRRRA